MRAERNDATALLRKVATGVAAVAILASSLASAEAANFFEKNFWLSGPNYSGKVPACDLPAAISEIKSRFATTESRFWNSSLKIDTFDHVHEIAFRPWGEEYIPRRFCEASVTVSGTEGAVPYAPVQYNGGKVGGGVVLNNSPRKIYYSIIEDGGFLSLSWGVEWCVEGLDRSWTYAPNCRMAQP